MAKYIMPAGDKMSFPVIKEGVHKTQVVNPKSDYAKGTGGAQISAGLKILEGPDAGAIVPHQWSLAEKALWRIKDDLRTLGCIDPKKHPVTQPFEIDDSVIPTLLKDKIGFAEFFTDTYENQPRSKLTTRGFLNQSELEGMGLGAVASGGVAVVQTAPSGPPSQEAF
jgi:hypothetical protein